jgi:hypothetical protein
VTRCLQRKGHEPLVVVVAVQSAGALAAPYRIISSIPMGVGQRSVAGRTEWQVMNKLTLSVDRGSGTGRHCQARPQLAQS